MAVGDAHVFLGFLTPVLTQLFFPKPPTTFLTCFCRGERRKYAGKKSRLNQGSNSQPPGHESDTLTTEPPRRGLRLVLTQISFQSHRLLFSYASAKMRGENTPERNFAPTGSRTYNHQVMSPTRSPLSHPAGEAYASTRKILDLELSLFQTSPGFYVSAVQVF